MKIPGGSLPGLALLVPAIFFSIMLEGQVKRAETEHFRARYETEAEPYVVAGLELLETVRTIATNNGFYLPEMIRFSVIRSDRNVLYFKKKSLKEIVWEYNDLKNFLPPVESGKKNIYGLCHEMGHLCMYNTNHNRNNWMSYDYREAWADYFGNLLVDSIYDRLGTGFWPDPHDYSEFSGMDYFAERIREDRPEMQTFYRAGMYWYELAGMLDFSQFGKLFDALEKGRVNNPGASEKYVEILTRFIPGEHTAEWFTRYAEGLILGAE